MDLEITLNINLILNVHPFSDVSIYMIALFMLVIFFIDEQVRSLLKETYLTT